MLSQTNAADSAALHDEQAGQPSINPANRVGDFGKFDDTTSTGVSRQANEGFEDMDVGGETDSSSDIRKVHSRNFRKPCKSNEEKVPGVRKTRHDR